MAVCEKTFNIMNRAPYAASIIPVEPLIPVEKTMGFDCSGKKLYRSPKETKAGVVRENTYGDDTACSTSGCC